MHEFELEITTPERQFIKEKVQMVVIPSDNGEVGVLAGHAPMVVVLKSGEIRFSQNDKWRTAAIADGFALIDQRRALLLCQIAEWPHEIDSKFALEEEKREKEKLRQAQSQREYVLTKANLSHAMARLRVLSHSSSINDD